MRFILCLWSAFLVANHAPTGLPGWEAAPHCAVKLTQTEPITRPKLQPQRPEDLPELATGKRSSRIVTRLAALTSAEFAALNGQAFVDAVATADDAGIYSLWTYDASTAVAISSSRVSLIVNAINAERHGDPARLGSLVYFIQIAFYHEFYQSVVSYDSALKAQAANAIVAVGSRADFLNEGNPGLADLRYHWSVAIDSVNSSHLALGRVEDLLRRYRNHPTAANDYYERSIAFNLFTTLARQVLNNASAGSASPWYQLINTSLMNVIRDFALERNYTADEEMIVKNALYALGNFSALHPTTASTARSILSDAYRTHDRFDGPWLRAVTDLNYFFNATLDNGTVLDLEGIRTELTGQVLPHEYVFDDGRLTFKTAISLASAEALYDAMQEVRAQFFRKTTFLGAVPGDANEALTLVIYGSPDDYQTYQPFLYGLSTNNGGIYIETWGTLFTYDRTPQQSTLTLEELLRHEYVHYLDARYVIVPGYGESPMYDNSRLTWYNEGLAEWLTGSTRVQGVPARSSYVSQINSDGTRMTIPQIVGVSYNYGFTFYRYAGLLFTYLDNHRGDLLVRLFDAVRGNNPAVLDALYNEMRADSGLQAGYNAYLDARIAEVQSGTGLFAEDVPTVRTPTSLPANNLSDIQADLTGYLPINGITNWDDRYQANGELILAINGDSATGLRNRFAFQLDQALIGLESQGTNFTSAVAWFGDLNLSGNTARATFVVEGPYSQSGSSSFPPAVPGALSASVSGNAVFLNWNANSEPDLTGYRVYRSQNSGGPYQLIAETATPAYTDNGPGPGSWYYVVSAYSSGGESYISSEVGTTVQGSSRLALHRYWNAGIGDHFYTTDFNTFGSGNEVWVYEGVQCYVESSQVPGSVPLHRYWSAGIGDHFYTTDFSIFGDGNAFWVYEGATGYVYPSQVAGTVPLYRYWNSGIGDHFYTTDYSIFGAGNAVWAYEGIQCYVFTSP